MSLRKLFRKKEKPIRNETETEIFVKELRPLFRPVKNKVDEKGYYLITCPNCLETFHVWEAEFRAGVGSVAKDENIGEGAFGDGGISGLNLFSEENMVSSEESILTSTAEKNELTAFPREIDQKYTAFRRKVGKIGQNDTPPALNKILRLFDENGDATGEVERVLLMDNDGNEMNHWIHLAGIKADDPSIYKKPLACVRDKYGHNSYDRVCPHCHNGISHLLGIYPSYVLAIVGNTFCGKSVYIKRLCQILEGAGILSRDSGYRFSGYGTGYAAEEAAEMDNRARYGEALLDPTRIEYMEPKVINCTRGTGEAGKSKLVLTLFDFPGEALQSGKEINDFFDHYSNVKLNVDGWLFLFDSANFQSVSDLVRQKHPELEKFLPDNLINEGMGSDNNKEQRQKAVTVAPQAVLKSFTEKFLKGQFNAPVAFVITKSDMLIAIKDDIREYAPDCMVPDPKFLQAIKYSKYDAVDLDVIQENSQEIQTMLGEDGLNDWTAVSALDFIKDDSSYAWFAVSAMGTQVASGHESSLANPIRVEEPVAWLLYMLGVLPGKSDDDNLWR